MKKKTGILIGILVSCILLPGLSYLGLAIYYQDSFYYGTWINGVYCTGKSVETVGEELAGQFSYNGLLIRGVDGEEYLKADTLSLEFDFEASLKEHLEKQNPFHWTWQLLTGHQNIELLPEVRFDEEELEKWIRSADFYQKGINPGTDSLSIVMTEEGYQLKEDKKDILLKEQSGQVIANALKQCGAEVDLYETGCYTKREDSPEMVEIRKFYEQIRVFQELSLTYQIKDEKRKVTTKEIAEWIQINEEGSFCLDKEGKITINEDKVRAFVSDLAAEYDTWHNHEFITHDGRIINISKGNYGIEISIQAESQFLLEILKEGSKEAITRVPEYTRDVTYNNQYKITDTYIEVDMGKQKLFYFEKGTLKLETDVVTGCTTRGNGTPEMVCYIYHMAEDTYLRGEGYKSYVNFWVAVYGGIGIHDATWRDEFGDEIYIKDGSHGCINTPLEKMDELYGILEVGIPVVIHN